ncbi:serine/threonine protein kinase [Streptacidiphilus sp. ASG 303]|uniref:serine/threonine-protein kinase n=1 Tax=Streptacidiphilus sp. ASG 303 TaxID=2896847 RepID=UPI001E401E0D|nr:serine/threonine-protein kinase [Streptacidiphilus sp. ASG 303]MCD0481930.1 serine/threonine protein kinase [Streptacidiphilus sp. ASG 303]
MTQAQGSTGRLLAGRYRLDSVLGRGGMGTVWRAEDEMLDRVVAVKELRFHGGVDEEEKRRLITRTLREAKAAARIRNNAAVTVFDVVEEDDRPWIVMELVESRSLADVIKEDGPLDPERAARIGLDLLGVLRSAHGHGILHRDVKPSNVLIGDDGRVVLTDFGIASVEGDPSVTSTGMLVGAPSYISPERARGQKPGPPADLWSLGATLYAMVEGKPPYDRGSAISTLTAVMTEDLRTPRNAGPLRPVIEGLLRKDPDERLDEPTTRTMLRRVVAEARRLAEAAAAAEAAVAATAVLPAAGAGDAKPAGDAAPSVPRQAGAPEKAVRAAGEGGAPAADASAAPAAKRAAGVLGGLLGTVRVGSRTAASGGDGDAGQGGDAGRDADAGQGGEAEGSARAAVPGARRAPGSTPAEGAPDQASPAQASPAGGGAGLSGKAAAAKAAGTSGAGAGKTVSGDAAARKAAAKKTAAKKAAAKRTTAKKTAPEGAAPKGAASAQAARPAGAAAAAGTAATAGKDRDAAGASEAPATAVLPVTDAAGPAAPGGGLGDRIREWRSAPPAERSPSPKALAAGALALVVLVAAVLLGVRSMADSAGGADGSRASGGRTAGPGPKPSGSSPASAAPGGAASTGASASAPGTADGGSPAAQEGSGPAATPSGDGGGSAGADGTGADGSGDAVPAGFTRYTSDREHLSVLVPEGTHYVKDKDGGVELHYKDWVLILDHRSDATGDVLADWRSREAQAAVGYPDYRAAGSVHRVDYRGWDAADWEFTFNRPPALKRVVSRAFLVGGDTDKGYLIQWIMPDGQWGTKEARKARDVSYASFRAED